MVNAQTVQGFQALPALRQIGLMVGLAASVALGVAVVLWSQEPNYTLLYANLTSKDAGKVVEGLQKSGIVFKINENTGAVMVESSQLQNARMQLAKDGVPVGGTMGFELMEKEQGFGTSQFVETVRYQRALEGELSRTISTLNNISKARVHLALPKRSVFLRDRSEPTASVTLDLYSGRRLDEGQVAAVVNLVSSSVPHLTADNVTVVDQRGNLLSASGGADGIAGMTSSQFSYNRKLEKSYVKSVMSLLEPVVGAGKIRTTINADLDFTVIERTQETYNPDLSALRSEQVSEDKTMGDKPASGIPGALSNQPPEETTLQDDTGDAAAGADGESSVPSEPRNSSTRSVRNYELDKTISHTRLAAGTIRRLSVAIVIDNKQSIDENGESVSQPWTEAELVKFTTLVKEAVGFSVERGDTVNIINAAFIQMPEIEDLPEASMMEQPWIWDIAKQAAGALGLLLVIFGVLKPVMRSLAEKGSQQVPAAGMLAAGTANEAMSEDQLRLSGANSQQAQLEAPKGGYEQNMETARTVVSEDPKRVAQVVNNWVAEDG